MNNGCLISPQDPRWAMFLERVRHDIYHSPDYAAADARRIGGQPMAFLLETGRGSLLLPMLLRRCLEVLGPEAGAGLDAVSPYGYPGFLLDDAAKAEPGFLDTAIDSLSAALAEAGVCTLFLRMHPILNEGIAASTTLYRFDETGTTVTVDLSRTEAELWSAMRKGHTNAVNQARRAGFVTAVSRLDVHIEDFVAVYSDVLERIQADNSYVVNDEYLAALAEDPSVWLIRAHQGSELAGAYIVFERCGIVHLHLGGARSRFIKPSPSNLLVHEVCRWAKERGNEIVQLGGGVGAAADDSLFRFKTGFSPDRRAFNTMRLVADAATLERFTALRASALGVESSHLEQSGFFPPYRAPLRELLQPAGVP